MPYLQDNLGFREGVAEKLPYEGKQKTILEILQAGSKEEDSPLSRAKNHFHNPLKPIEDAGLDDWPLSGSL